MTRGKRTSSKKEAEVINAKLSNPDNSLRDIQKQTWVNYVTAKRILDEVMPDYVTSSNTIKKLVEQNNLIMLLSWDKILWEFDAWKEMRMDELLKSRDLALKQNKLIEATGEWEKEIKVSFEI